MIDYFALALGHGLLAIALLRLVVKQGLDEDPLIGSIKDETKANRKVSSAEGRNTARRERDDAPGEDA